MRKALTLLVLSIAMVSCTTTTTTTDQYGYSTNSNSISNASNMNQNLVASNECAGKQTDMPAKGEEVAKVSTTLGDFTLRFFACDTPETVKNFKELAKKGYYNGLIFHRVIKDFMIQGGDPTGTGAGGESYKGKEPIIDEFSPNLSHIYGAVSMANRGPNTGTSQFFIVNTKQGTPHLNGMHSVFAQVFEGLETIEKISNTQTDTCQPYENRAGCDKPLTDVKINTITIEAY